MKYTPMQFQELNAVSGMPTSKYRVLVELGSGGMARVFLAVSQGLAGFSKLVVLKVLRGDLASIAEFRNGFLREARLSARMNHANVVAVNEVEVLNGLPIIVMEYLQGQPLSNILRRVLAKVPSDVLIRILVESLSGLHYAHELTDFDGKPLQLVHRDFTPQNIFVGYDGSVKVLDFGIAQATRRSFHEASDTVQGKLRYMAPEQLTSAPLDRRTDVFAAGVLLTEIVTGQRFWGERSDAEIVAHLKSGWTPTPRMIMPDCPVELERICAKALALDRQHRYQTAAEMQQALEVYLDSHSRRVTAQELGRMVSEWFAPEREHTQQLIESSLADDTYVSWSRITSAAPIETTSPTPLSGSATRTIRDLPRRSLDTIAVKPKKRWRWLGYSAAAASVFSLVALWGLMRQQPAPEVIEVKAATAIAPPPVRDITLNVTAVPSTATILLDDVASTDNPYVRTVSRDFTWHELRIEAVGYATQQQRVQFSRDFELVVNLDKLPNTPRDAPHARTKTATPKHTPPASEAPPPTHNNGLACSPPFTYDERGVKRFKPECL